MGPRYVTLPHHGTRLLKTYNYSSLSSPREPLIGYIRSPQNSYTERIPLTGSRSQDEFQANGGSSRAVHPDNGIANGWMMA